MAVRLGDEAPDFTADTTDGELRFHEWKGDSWTVLFSHPKDFTPVCTTELGTVAKLKDEFEKRNTKVIGLSVDPIEDHHEWAKDIEETQGAALNFPMIADPDHVIADLYDMIHPNASNTLTVRSVFVIGPDNTVKLTLTYPASTGRNFQELLRVIDSGLGGAEALPAPGRPQRLSPFPHVEATWGRCRVEVVAVWWAGRCYDWVPRVGAVHVLHADTTGSFCGDNIRVGSDVDVPDSRCNDRLAV
jgi:alkyl hydroperoxide reductase subunit AhpC